MANPRLRPNALQKPSEKAKGNSHALEVPAQSDRLTISEKERLRKLEAVIENPGLAVGFALSEIRDKRLYRQSFQTFELYCQQRWGYSRTRAYEYIEGVKTLKSLPSEMSGIPDKLGQLTALAKVPEEQRAQVLKATAEKGNVTAKAITEAAKEIKGKGAAPEVKDEIGRIIPEELITEWNRSMELTKELKRHAQAIVEIMRNGIEKNDPLFREYSNSIISQAEGLRYSVTAQLRAYAVCHNCQGRLPSRCQTCHGRGFYSKYYFDSPSVPEKIKKMLGIT